MSALGKALRSLMKVAPAGGRSRTSRKLRGIADAKKKALKSQGIKDRSPSIASLKQRYATKEYRKGPWGRPLYMIRLEDAKGSLHTLPAGWGRATRLERRASEANRNVRIGMNKARKEYDAHKDVVSQFDHFGGPGKVTLSEAMQPLEIGEMIVPEQALMRYGRELFSIKHDMGVEMHVFKQLTDGYGMLFDEGTRRAGINIAPARMAHRLQRMKRRATKKNLKKAAIVGGGAYAATREKH